jgi:hypothetical protein
MPLVCAKNLWILRVWKNSFFQASSESIACAFYQLQTLYQSIRFQMLPVQKYYGNINCNTSKYFSRCSFFILSRYRWLLTSAVSKWVYIRKIYINRHLRSYNFLLLPLLILDTLQPYVGVISYTWIAHLQPIMGARLL